MTYTEKVRLVIIALRLAADAIRAKADFPRRNALALRQAEKMDTLRLEYEALLSPDNK